MGKNTLRLLVIMMLAIVMACTAASSVYAEDAQDADISLSTENTDPTMDEPENAELPQVTDEQQQEADVLTQEDPVHVPEAEVADAAEETKEEKVEYTVDFLNMDHSLFLKVALAQGDLVFMPDRAPAAEGYVFMYWYSVSDGAGSPFAFSTEITGNIVLKAHFTQIEENEPAEDALFHDEEVVTEAAAQQESKAADEPAAVMEENSVPDTTSQADAQNADGHSAGATANAQDLSRCKVMVYSDAGNVVQEGQMVTLTGVLVGFEGLDVTVQWQYDEGDGWMNAEGANDLAHAYRANAQSMQYRWRMLVSVGA